VIKIGIFFCRWYQRINGWAAYYLLIRCILSVDKDIRMPRFSRRTFLKWSALMGGAAALAGCQSEPMPEAPLLNLHNWADYTNPETLDGFRKETGIFVYQTIFGSNEEMRANLNENPPGTYDVIVPTDFVIREMIEAGQLLRLDHALLPNIPNLEARFRTGRDHDPNSDYSITKDWGVTGLIWRPEQVPEPITSWADLWALAPKYSGRIVVVESGDDVINATLKLLGYSINDPDPAHMAEVGRKLMELRPHVGGILSDYYSTFQEGAAVLGIGWNGDAYQLQTAYQAPVQFVIPAEGSFLWEDAWCIAANALHPRNAHAFINYLLRPEVAVVEFNYIGYGTAVAGVAQLLPESIRTNPTLYPPSNVLNRLEQAGRRSSEDLKRRGAVWEMFVAG
jgi:spermidine/putrescine transport system substrate-binding protein